MDACWYWRVHKDVVIAMDEHFVAVWESAEPFKKLHRFPCCPGVREIAGVDHHVAPRDTPGDASVLHVGVRNGDESHFSSSI
jgi:hypothetical protein